MPLLPEQAKPQALPELPAGPDPDRLRGPIQMTADMEWTTPLLILLAGFLFLGITICVVRKIRSNRKISLNPKPSEIAVQTIKEASESASDNLFPSTLSQALRDFIKTIFPFSEGATTVELSAVLETSTIQEKSRLIDLLNDCDRLKFSASTLSPKQRAEMTETALEFLQSTTTKEAAQQDPTAKA